MTPHWQDEDGYLWCPSCEVQLSASLWCDACEDYAWAHPEPITLEEWKARNSLVDVEILEPREGRDRRAA